MKLNEKIKLFSGMIQCRHPVYLWEYDEKLNLLYSNAGEHEKFIDKNFHRSKEIKRMKELIGKSEEPMIFGSDSFGIQWGVVSHKEKDQKHFFVMGPVFCSESSEIDIDYVLLQYIHEGERVPGIPIAFRNQMVDVFKTFPVVTLFEFAKDLAMLEYCINGNTVNPRDLMRGTGIISVAKPAAKKNRQRTWQAEQALLSMVRNGDLNYREAAKKASNLSSGVRITQNEPLRQGKISIETFITLCVRAAIEGGLSPEEAYSVGDGYIQEVEDASNITTLAAISNRMYEDFITRVHRLNSNPDISREIRNVMNYIEIHAGEDIKIQQLAKLAGYTEYYLSRKFKNETHWSINDYINITRIERAKILLTTTDQSIAVIADSLNFCTSSYFASVFKKFENVSPAEYREKYR